MFIVHTDPGILHCVLLIAFFWCSGAVKLLFISDMMADSSEEQEIVFEKIGELTVEQLIVVYSELKLPAIEKTKQVKPNLLRVIIRYLSSNELEQSEDG